MAAVRPDEAKNEVRRRNQRLVLRFLMTQICCVAVVAVLVAAVYGMRYAHAVLTGGVVVAAGNGLFGWRLFAPGVAPVRVLARGLYAGAALKWLWVGAALGLALGPAQMAALPLLVGVVVAQIGFWLGLAFWY